MFSLCKRKSSYIHIHAFNKLFLICIFQMSSLITCVGGTCNSQFTPACRYQLRSVFSSSFYWFSMPVSSIKFYRFTNMLQYLVKAESSAFHTESFCGDKTVVNFSQNIFYLRFSRSAFYSAVSKLDFFLFFATPSTASLTALSSRSTWN